MVSAEKVQNKLFLVPRNEHADCGMTHRLFRYNDFFQENLKTGEKKNLAPILFTFAQFW
jgi:hypothetical protein